MELSEEEKFKKYARNCSHCSRNTLPPFEHEFTWFSCGYNVIKRKHELSEIQRKKINFISRLKFSQLKLFCKGVDVYKIEESDDFDKIFEVLSALKTKKLKINKTRIEKWKDMNKYPVFEQDHWSRTVEGIYKIGHDSTRLMKWLIFYDRLHFDKMNYYD